MPVVSAKQMLDWVETQRVVVPEPGVERRQLTFTVSPGAGARNLDMLVPARAGNGY